MNKQTLVALSRLLGSISHACQVASMDLLEVAEGDSIESQVDDTAPAPKATKKKASKKVAKKVTKKAAKEVAAEEEEEDNIFGDDDAIAPAPARFKSAKELAARVQKDLQQGLVTKDKCKEVLESYEVKQFKDLADDACDEFYTDLDVASA